MGCGSEGTRRGCIHDYANLVSRSGIWRNASALHFKQAFRIPQRQSMNPQDRDELADKLKQRRVTTLEAIASFQDSTRPVELDQTTQGRLSRMDAISQQQMALASKTHLTIELTRIEAALARVESGKFGLCGRCKLDIPIERLRADPSIPFCMECLEEVQEERRRQGYPVRNR